MKQADLFPAMQMSAFFSGPGDCYRDELRRIWDASKLLLPVCMVNPSDADGERNDPTLLVLIHFGKLWGFGGLLIVNLASYCSPSPAAMFAAADPIGPDNAVFVERAITYARDNGGRLLAAWGNHGAALVTRRTGCDPVSRAAWFCDLADRHGVQLICLGRTESGHPKHPLARGKHFVPRDQQPIVWRPASV